MCFLVITDTFESFVTDESGRFFSSITEIDSLETERL